MSQQILYQSRYGAVLASDSRVVIAKADVKTFDVQQKIYPLGKYGCITSLGAGIGIDICRQVQALVEAREPADFTAVLELATSVLSRYYHQ